MSADASEPKCNVARSTLMAYSSAIEMYAVEHGLPADETWFDSLVEAGLLKASQHRDDPWGNPYYYRTTGKTYDLRTLGPDAEYGTADDQTKKDGWRWTRCDRGFTGWLRCG